MREKDREEEAERGKRVEVSSEFLQVVQQLLNLNLCLVLSDKAAISTHLLD